MGNYVLCSDGRMRRKGYYVIGYYNDTVESPKVPGEMAIEVWCASEYVRELEADILGRRTDIGSVEWSEVK